MSKGKAILELMSQKYHTMQELYDICINCIDINAIEFLDELVDRLLLGEKIDDGNDA